MGDCWAVLLCVYAAKRSQLSPMRNIIFQFKKNHFPENVRYNQSGVSTYNLHFKYLTAHLANKVGGDHQVTQALFFPRMRVDKLR